MGEPFQLQQIRHGIRPYPPQKVRGNSYSNCFFGHDKATIWRTDGEKSLGGKVDALISVEGITIERSAPATQAQNGAAERSGGLIITKARCLRITAHLPTNLWPEMAQTAAYLANRAPKRRLGWKTPYADVRKS